MIYYAYNVLTFACVCVCVCNAWVVYLYVCVYVLSDIKTTVCDSHTSRPCQILVQICGVQHTHKHTLARTERWSPVIHNWAYWHDKLHAHNVNGQGNKSNVHIVYDCTRENGLRLNNRLSLILFSFGVSLYKLGQCKTWIQYIEWFTIPI